MNPRLLFTAFFFSTRLLAQEAITDPFEVSKPKPFKREDVMSVVIETNTRQIFSALKTDKECWVKEELVITDREVIDRWADLYKAEESVNDEARNQYYIGEPVLCHVLLRDREEQTIRWFPVGLPAPKGPISKPSELVTRTSTLFGKEVISLLQKHRPYVIEHYARSSREAATWRKEMEAKATGKVPAEGDSSP